MSAHQLARRTKGWECTACGLTYAGQPRAACLGKPTWLSASAIPATLATSAGLHRRGLTLPDATLPPAGFLRTPHHAVYPLFPVSAAVPRRRATAAMVAAGEKGRRADRTCAACGELADGPGDLWRARARHRQWPVYPDVLDIREPRLCDACVRRRWDEHDRLRRERARVNLRALIEQRVAVIDFESTALDRPRVLEVAVVLRDGRVLVDELVDPELPAAEWDAEASTIHGIRPEDVVGRPTWRELEQRVVAALLEERIEALMAWGAFDYDLVRSEARRRGEKDAANGLAASIIDVMPWYVDLSAIHLTDDGPNRPCERASLQEAAWERGVVGGSHRARGDCEATWRVLEAAAEGRWRPRESA